MFQEKIPHKDPVEGNDWTYEGIVCRSPVCTPEGDIYVMPEATNVKPQNNRADKYPHQRKWNNRQYSATEAHYKKFDQWLLLQALNAQAVLPGSSASGNTAQCV